MSSLRRSSSSLSHSTSNKKACKLARLSSRDRTKRAIWQFFDEGITYYTPDTVQDLPFYAKYIVGAVVLMTYVSLFVTFCSVYYDKNVSTKFLVPIDQDVSSSTCEDALRPISVSYMVDSQGFPSGVSEFTYNSSIYQFQSGFLRKGGATILPRNPSEKGPHSISLRGPHQIP